MKAEPRVEPPGFLRRVIWSCAAFIVAFVAAFLAGDVLLRLILAPIQSRLNLPDTAGHIVWTSPQDYLIVITKIAVLIGFGMALPVIAYQLWLIIKQRAFNPSPRVAFAFALLVSLAFWAGFVVAQWMYTPSMIRFFSGATAVSSDPAIQPALAELPRRTMLSHALSNIIMFGLGFVALVGGLFWYFERGDGGGTLGYDPMAQPGFRPDHHPRIPNDSDQWNNL